MKKTLFSAVLLMASSSFSQTMTYRGDESVGVQKIELSAGSSARIRAETTTIVSCETSKQARTNEAVCLIETREDASGFTSRLVYFGTVNGVLITGSYWNVDELVTEIKAKIGMDICSRFEVKK